MSKYKEQFVLNIAQYPEVIVSSIIYDCSEFFKSVENTEDENYKKIIAKKLGSYLWHKYMMDKDDIRQSPCLYEIINSQNIAKDLLIHTINFLDSTADENPNEQLLEISKKGIEESLDKIGKHDRKV